MRAPGYSTKACRAATNGCSSSFGSLRATYEGLVILNGGMDGVRAQAALDAGQADLISFARPFISNPDLVQWLQQGATLTAPNPATFYTPGPEGCVDCPALAG
ncbi:MAG: hypothetical protein EOO71_20975 [Myxococcaceae bacterium]|nr:MAG: hypothetical protein EOO71_20975 [Myxococcaceae bacterium]